MFYLIGIGITFFLVFILISKKGKSSADLVLTLWLCVIGIHLTLFYLLLTKLNVNYPQLLGFEISMPFLHGPLLFLYISELTKLKSNYKYKALHFLPYLLSLLSLSPFWLLKHQEKVKVYQANGEQFRGILDVLLVGYILSGIFYTYLSIKKLLKYRQTITQYYSDTEKINLKWLLYLTIGLSLIWLIVIFMAEDEYIFSAIVLYVIFIGYFGIKQVGIFTNDLSVIGSVDINNLVSEELNNTSNQIKIKYEKSGLGEDEIEIINYNLDQLMKIEKCFKNAEITLPELAKKLKVHANTLSQVINTVKQKNFYDYINEMRVEEFKLIANSPENKMFTLLALAYECGFNSKTSFNRNFKKVTQISPSDYVKQSKIDFE